MYETNGSKFCIPTLFFFFLFWFALVRITSLWCLTNWTRKVGLRKSCVISDIFTRYRKSNKLVLLMGSFFFSLNYVGHKIRVRYYFPSFIKICSLLWPSSRMKRIFEKPKISASLEFLLADILTDEGGFVLLFFNYWNRVDMEKVYPPLKYGVLNLKI